MPAAVLLRHNEAAYLAAHLRRLTSWNANAAVRVQLRGNTFGVFGAPPFDCQSFIALPVVESRDAEGLDDVVSAGRLRDVIGDVTVVTDQRWVPVPDPIGPRAELTVLPPTGPWLPAERGTAGDVRPLVEAAVADFRTRADALGPDAPQRLLDSLADEVWSRPGWGGMPLRALHAAVLLGLLPHDGLKVESATCEGFKRLLTPGGQVFVRTSGLPPTLSLAVVRG